MKKEFDLEIELEAGKKAFTVVSENESYTLIESGSIVAMIKETAEGWKTQKGSYSDSDVAKIGEKIKEMGS
ncbi:hypothetical protein [Pedobacter sp. SYSU D00535]|uniref:hypothetical protein n=1 Tax=Pedobacter sp. SYSU D00535 TaxID=2810308 RepID=UPI001A967C5C|nr:hypothetical protein [Pedobacter sp. SYSU D00535]